MSVTLSRVVGVVLVVLGVLGFFNNPVLGMFDVDTAHNVIHIVLGLILLLAPGKNSLRSVGVIALVLGVIGLLTEGKLLGLVQSNDAADWLHVVVGAVLLGVSCCRGGSAAPVAPAAPSNPSPMV